MHHSDMVVISTGALQGSVLGSLLFSISMYMNDLNVSNDYFNFLMYSDDTSIYFNLGDFNPICSNLPKSSIPNYKEKFFD